MEAPPRPPYYLITGLIIGIVAGLLYGWLLTPVESLDAHPQDLRADFKDAYRALIARAYVSNSDLGRAQGRLALLGDEDPARALAVQAQLTLGEGVSAESARALGFLAAALENGPIIEPAESTPLADTGTTNAAPSSTPAPSNEAGEPTATRTPPPGGTTTPTGTAAPANTTPTILPSATSSSTPTATQGAPFVLLDIPLVCNPDLDPPLIQVYIYDAAGNQVPGVAIIITWEGNSNRFITGLKPEFGAGYADFTMDPNKSYTLRIEDGGEPVTSITGRMCEDQSEPYWGTWRLNFVQP